MRKYTNKELKTIIDDMEENKMLKAQEIMTENEIRIRLLDFEGVKNEIMPRFAYSGMNVENMPHRKFEDVKITYYVEIKKGHMAQLNNSLLEFWGITEGDLHAIAMANMKKAKSNIVTNFGMPGMGMTILTNKSGRYGAVAMLDPEILEEAYAKIGGDFYILPSSIHEVIILPGALYSPAELQKMVVSVNATEVTEKERLSDSVYIYRQSEGKVEKVEF